MICREMGDLFWNILFVLTTRSILLKQICNERKGLAMLYILLSHHLVFSSNTMTSSISTFPSLMFFILLVSIHILVNHQGLMGGGGGGVIGWLATPL